jgi:hypothetical protein
MKKIAIISLILFFALSGLAQEAPKTVNTQPQNLNQVQPAERTSSQSSLQPDQSAVEYNNQENVSTYQQEGKSTQKVPVKIVTNTRSGDKKVRVKFGSAVDSGPRLKLEKKDVKSKSAPADLKKNLGETKKIKPLRLKINQE